MSQVYLKDRKETAYDPVDCAADLQDILTRYVMNEKYMPKKWRFVVGIKLIEKVDELTDYVIAANETWAKGKTNMELRHKYWRAAYIACKQLDRKLQRAKTNIDTVTPDSLKTVIELLAKEEGLLIHKIRSDKDMG